MSVISFDDGVHGRVSFDITTGQTIYDADRKRHIPMWLQVVGWTTLTLVGTALTIQTSQYLRAKLRRKRLKALARQQSDICDRASLLYYLSEEHVGGFMTNASIQAIERDPHDQSRLYVFASGGWTYAPHRLSGIPLYQRPGSASFFTRISQICRKYLRLNDSSSSSSAVDTYDSRTRWWTGLTLGKSMQLNGSLAFMIALQLIEQEKSLKEANTTAASSTTNTTTSQSSYLTYLGRRITNIGFCSGTLYSNLSHVHQSHPPLTSRLEVVCEIGTLEPEKYREWQTTHGPWNQPDLNSRDLGELCTFGTNTVLELFRSNGKLPATDKSVPGVLWERLQIRPPDGSDQWFWIEVETAYGSPERIVIDSSLYLEKGIKLKEGRFGDEQLRNQKSNTQSNNSPTTSWFTRLWSNLTQFITTTLTSTLTDLDPPLSEMPRLHTLTPFQLQPFQSRVSQEVIGPTHVIRYLQDTVLINSQPPNAILSQMRAVLTKLLKLYQLPTKFILTKMEVDRHYSSSSTSTSSTSSSNTSHTNDWSSSVYEPQSTSKRQPSKSEKRRQKKKAKLNAATNQSNQRPPPSSSHTIVTDEISIQLDELAEVDGDEVESDVNEDEREPLQVFSPELNEVD